MLSVAVGAAHDDHRTGFGEPAAWTPRGPQRPPAGGAGGAGGDRWCHPRDGGRPGLSGLAAVLRHPAARAADEPAGVPGMVPPPRRLRGGGGAGGVGGGELLVPSPAACGHPRSHPGRCCPGGPAGSVGGPDGHVAVAVFGGHRPSSDGPIAGGPSQRLYAGSAGGSLGADAWPQFSTGVGIRLAMVHRGGGVGGGGVAVGLQLPKS